MHYYGFKLVMLCSLEGVLVVYDLVPANTDERVAAESPLALIVNCDILADKGFIGQAWQQLIRRGDEQ